MSSSILLDFDGVLIKNKNLGKLIEQKSIEFIKHKYSKSLHECTLVNTHFYKTYGHTALGLDTSNYKQNILDYNQFVFSKLDYNELANMITDSDKELLSRMKEYSYSFGLFTNAPLSWCENICHIAGTDIEHFIDDTKLFTSDNGLIKPKDEFYTHVENKLKKDKTIHFIDDSLINLNGIIASNPKWVTHHIDTSINLHCYLENMIC